MVFLACDGNLENDANTFYLKTGFPLFFFWLVMGTSGK